MGSMVETQSWIACWRNSKGPWPPDSAIMDYTAIALAVEHADATSTEPIETQTGIKL
jgi:hypothetical protein